MTKLESLKKNSHFETVLRNRVINNDLFSIYRMKNFIKKKSNNKKFSFLYSKIVSLFDLIKSQLVRSFKSIAENKKNRPAKRKVK